MTSSKLGKALKMITVGVVNQSTVESDKDVEKRLKALDDQNNIDLAPLWQVPVTKRIMLKTGAAIPKDVGRLEFILDDADQAGALGYHSSGDQFGMPTSYIFSKTTLDNGALPSVVHSHESLEMAVDPFISYTIQLDLPIGGFRGGYVAAVMVEIADGPEADQYGYLRSGIQLSNFVTPAWFSMPWKCPEGIKSGQFDFVGNVPRPFSLDQRGRPLGINPGGYIALRVEKVVRDWFQVTASHSNEVQAIENAVPSGKPHVMKSDGSLMRPEDICPFSRRARWFKRHGA